MNKPLVLLAFFGLCCATAAAETLYAPVIAGRALSFPEDQGSHPQYRTEWWYVTGWLTSEAGESLGFQITFFRTKPSLAADNPSAFAPTQIMIAHCALSDPKHGRLWQDQRIARSALGLAGAAEGDTNVWIGAWSLKHDGQYVARIAAEDFSLDLKLSETQPVLINGDNGFSRKGPGEQAASYYYSLPHMQVTGTVSRKGPASRVTGEAWFDHEWSSEYLDAQAAGWDWIGINLEGGGALMAFQIRGLDGARRWAGGTFRSGDGVLQVFAPTDVDFRAGRRWTSPRTGIAYPVEWTIRAGGHEFTLRPLLDDQENDTRLSTGAIYWEGAVRADDKSKTVGRGYLELTGYGERLRLR
ncbi:MAG TPA: lipocalin-like domain-containing protein [Steroidobacteraceae bacterium]|nr:lipocalin-like domain-containing protein [Steroidobacteraceae bacterium]